MSAKNNQKVLVIGSGGREYALAWKLSQSPRISQLYVAPGNAGTAEFAENVAIAATEIDKITEFAKNKNIDLVLVAPDDPQADGLVDLLEGAGIRTFGSRQAAAQIEASKAFAKDLMKKQGIPTANYRNFSDHSQALSYVHEVGAPIVVKASGLALGKGVYVCKTLPEAEQALKEIMLDSRFGDAGNEVVIEEFLEGQEISIHALHDGKTTVIFPSTQDHKQIGEGDTGPNTGGVGAFGPVPWVSDELMAACKDQVVDPALAGLAAAGASFKGCLYPGLMIQDEQLKVIEYNARFGDPETQVYMLLLESDLYDLVEGVADVNLSAAKPKWFDGFAACVTVVAGGYPGKYRKGDVVSGIDEANKLPNVQVFHANTKIEGGAIVTNGGRIVNVCGRGKTLDEALKNAYDAIKLIHFDDMYYRRDIGFRVKKAT